MDEWDATRADWRWRIKHRLIRLASWLPDPVIRLGERLWPFDPEACEGFWFHASYWKYCRRDMCQLRRTNYGLADDLRDMARAMRRYVDGPERPADWQWPECWWGLRSVKLIKVDGPDHYTELPTKRRGRDYTALVRALREADKADWGLSVVVLGATTKGDAAQTL